MAELYFKVFKPQCLRLEGWASNVTPGKLGKEDSQPHPWRFGLEWAVGSPAPEARAVDPEPWLTLFKATGKWCIYPQGSRHKLTRIAGAYALQGVLPSFEGQLQVSLNKTGKTSQYK